MAQELIQKVDMRDLSWVESELQNRSQLKKAALFDRRTDQWFGATIDSRGECKGRLFFALKGESTDGHKFVDAALSAGSCAVIVDDPKTAKKLTRTKAPHFLVSDTLVALQELARAYRNSLDATVIAITGSVGKTSTKEYVRAVLKSKYRVHANPGNLNNHIGVPLTILDTDPGSEYLVSEIGANHVGEIEHLSAILRPDIGVITNVFDAHIGLFGSRDKIAEAKSELVMALESGGIAVLPGDDEYFELLSSRSAARVMSFGESAVCTFRVSGIIEKDGRFAFEVNHEEFTIESFARYNVVNAVAAIAVGDACGVEVERTREALLAVEPIAGRAQVYRGNDIVVIDDSYNANPTSMKMSIETLLRFPARRRVAILGDMGELGVYAADAHRDMGMYLARVGVDLVFWLGSHGNDVREGAEGSPTTTEFRFFENMKDLVEEADVELSAGDAVLVKASRVCRLDEVVVALRATFMEGGR